MGDQNADPVKSLSIWTMLTPLGLKTMATSFLGILVWGTLGE